MYSRASLCLGRSVSGNDACGAARLQRSSQGTLRLMGFVHGSGNIPKPHEMEGVVSVGILAQLSPHRHPLMPWHHLFCRGKHQGAKCSSSPAAAGRGLCHRHQPAVPRPSSLRQTPGVLCGSVPSWTAWVKRSLCSPGRRCCLTRLLCGLQCVSVAVFGRLVGGRSPRLTAPTVVLLQAPG